MFGGLFVVLVVAALVPLALGFFPQIPLPGPVLEIVLGIVIGPSVLGWVHPGPVLTAVATLGLAFLLFLAGLEIDLRALRGRRLLGAGLGMAGSVLLAVPVVAVLGAASLVQNPVLVGVILLATSLGLVLPLLADAGQLDTAAGQLVVAGSSLGELTAVVLLSLLFSVKAAPIGGKLILFALLLILAALATIGLARAERRMLVMGVLDRLSDTTAQLRVRLAVLLLVGLAAAADRLGFEAILGAFLAGAVLRLADEPAADKHPQFHVKLSGLGYGFLIPVFFVNSGVTFDLRALTSHPATLARVPVFLAALLLVRGLPAALVYARLAGRRAAAGAGLLQSTSLPLIVAGTQVGLRLDQIRPANAAALVARGPAVGRPVPRARSQAARR